MKTPWCLPGPPKLARWTAGLVSLVVLLLDHTSVLSAVPARTATAEGWRYLLVVETSRAMAPRQEAATKILRELIESNMRGEALPGDSLGIWTFNSELRTGEFPLQRWTASNATEIADAVVGFIHSQTNENAAKFERALQPICELATHSEGLTVILSTAGHPVRGTAFDEQINAVTARWRDYQDAKSLPFITVLRVQKRQFADFTVTPSPWPLSWPWPPRALAKSTEDHQAKSQDASKLVRSPKAATAPLLFTGRKPESKTATPAEEKFDEVLPSPKTAPLSMPVEPPLAQQVRTNPPQVIEPVAAPVVAHTARPENTTHADLNPLPPTPLGSVANLTEKQPVTSGERAPVSAKRVEAAVDTEPTTISNLSQVAPDPQPPASSQAVTTPQPDTGPSEAPIVSGDAEPREPQPAESRSANRLLQAIAAIVGLSALGVLLWFLRGFRKPHRASIITQSLERQSSFAPAAAPRPALHAHPAQPELAGKHPD